MLFCCLRRNIEACCHTLRRRLPLQANSVAHQRLVSSGLSRLSVLHFAFTARHEARYWLAQNRDFCLTHLHSTLSLGGPLPNIAMTFGTKKLEWCCYPTVKKNWRDLYSFRQTVRTWRTDRRTDRQRMTAKAAKTIEQWGCQHWTINL